MAADTRTRMVETTARILSERGLYGASFTEILEQSGAARGSIYYHFPKGKDQLVSEAIALVKVQTLEQLGTQRGRTPEELTTAFLGLWKRILENSQFTVGCTILAVTIASDAPQLLDDASDAFRSWRECVAELLHEGGLSLSDATDFAALLLASTEGAIVLARAERDIAPFETVSRQLLGRLHAIQEKAAAN
ncbi:TetR/AcrR family transcriptional regulator [Herbiconiux sp. CPCC 205763]|uniref:TetR/AcrR family transcriptional regulator n=1 Tax=Herbiconiux aconitum TaxID=2970913 RepID=A0ABT2GNH3_9MICO|nr:TetR/AcrR family transcriptional regulator [Herbiconiux aconitum]MCS5717738.1 TetR/AcrR family transcriptional regulator [Herbiconiux aconitum]